jgi:predicted phosphodiesterase
MKVALISDIHGNLPALEAALADIRTHGTDQIIFLGDAATLGPQPKETLDLLRTLDCVCIMGNHDAALLDLTRAADLQIGASLFASLEWGQSLLNETDFAFLRSFRPTYELELGNTLSLLCFHGSPRSNTDMILSTTTDAIMDGYFAGQPATILAGGHTHVQMLRQRGMQAIINTGSVGSAFMEPFLYNGTTPRLIPWAEYALVRAEHGGWSVDLRRVPFDTESVCRALEAGDNPSRDWWLSQYR